MARIARWIVLLSLAHTAMASAQETGGSFGGSDHDWGGSSDERSGGSDHDFGGSHDESFERPDHDWGASTSVDESPSTGEAPTSWAPAIDTWAELRADRGRPRVTEAERAARAWPQLPALEISLGAWGILFALGAGLRMRGIWSDARPGPASAFVMKASRRARAVSVTRLSVAFDGDARRAIQRVLRGLAGAHDLSRAAGRRSAAARVLGLIEEHIESACYAKVASFSTTTADGPGALARVSQDLRARYRADTVGRVRSPAPAGMKPRSEDGPGLVVVSLVLGTTGKAVPDAPLRRRAEVRATLAELLPAEEDLLGLELVWSPSEDADRLSSYELEALYPDLEKLLDASDIGAMRCAACGGGFSRELGQCPHCGKPV